MNTNVFEIMKLFGYTLIEEDGGRILFYEPDWEETVQIWKKKTAQETVEMAVDLIKTRLIDRSKSFGRMEVQSEIKKALGL